MGPIVGRLLERRALLDGPREAVVCGERRLSFQEFNRLAGRMASFLGDCGITRGDRVAALLHNGIEFCALYHAVARLGAILCPVNWRLAAPEVAYIAENCGAQVLLFGEAFAQIVDQMPKLPDLRHRIVVDGGFSEILAAHAPTEDTCPAAPEDPLLIVYTSGTTGRPKGAVLTQSQMVWSSLTMAATIDYRRGDVGLISAPMFHVGGLSFATIFVHLGATAVLTPVWDPDRVLELIEREGINHFFAVATMLDGLTGSDKFEGAKLGSLRWIMSGGGPLPVALIDRFAERGVPLIQSYGTTETAGPASVVPVSNALAKAGTSGLPFVHTDIRITDAAGRAVAAGISGEVLVKAPHVSAGYWENSEASQATFVDGWFRTGDQGFLDADGYLHIKGRLKEMIISGGENVYPAEIERVLQSHPKVTDIAVIGLPDPQWGEVICAVVHCGDGEAPTLDDLVAHCGDQLARYKHPRRLVVSPDPLARNQMGKLLRDDIAKTVSG